MGRHIPDNLVGEKVIITKSSGTYIIGTLVDKWEAHILKPRDDALVVEDMTGEVFLIEDEGTKVELYSEERADKLDYRKSNFWKLLNE